MPLQADHLVDRRRLKRRLAAWRLVTVAAIIAVVILALERVGVLGRDYVARLDIEGIITEDFDRDEALAAIERTVGGRAPRRCSKTRAIAIRSPARCRRSPSRRPCTTR